jgi:antitoxin HicB
VTSPVLPEPITEGDTLEDTLAHVPDAVAAVLELYEDLNKPVPAHPRQPVDTAAISLESSVAVT